MIFLNNNTKGDGIKRLEDSVINRVEKNHGLKKKKNYFLNLNRIFLIYLIFLFIGFFNLLDFFKIWYTQCHKIFYYQAIWCQYTSVRTLCFCIKKHTKLC